VVFENPPALKKIVLYKIILVVKIIADPKLLLLA
jgi:hypothetical protein